MSESFIEVKKMAFSYDESDNPDKKRIFNDFDLVINRGEFVAVIGHNGSGKSTLAKLLCGILQPMEGDILIDGMSVKDDDNFYKIKEKCGMIFQNPDNQIVASIVEEDVAFAPENLGMEPAKIRETVDRVLLDVGMSEYAKSMTNKLSGGQKQRIAIAGILAMSPECIIFDEATSMLDPSGRKDINRVMRKLNKEKGITVINITHYMSEASEADRVIVLNKGSIYMDGTPEEIFSKVDGLKSISLSSPQVTELFDILKKHGVDLPGTVLHTLEAADGLEAFCASRGIRQI